MPIKPNIPDVSLIQDALVRDALQAIKRIIQTREGVIGSESFIPQKSFQRGQQKNVVGWVKVSFPTAFDVIPTVMTAAVKDDSASTLFFVETRNITVSGFEFRSVDHDGTDHTSLKDFITWIAFDG